MTYFIPLKIYFFRIPQYLQFYADIIALNHSWHAHNLTICEEGLWEFTEEGLQQAADNIQVLPFLYRSDKWKQLLLLVLLNLIITESPVWGSILLNMGSEYNQYVDLAS